MDQDEVLAKVSASTPRRWIGIFMLVAVGVLVIYVAFASPPSLGWQAFLVVIGVLAVWMAERMRQATEVTLELTQTELRDSSGLVLAQIDNIKSLDSGFFAFKPSNGFMVHMKTPGPRVWRPGIWWRMGRRIGVGGVTPGAQTKAMAEILAAILAMRDQDSHTT